MLDWIIDSKHRTVVYIGLAAVPIIYYSFSGKTTRKPQQSRHPTDFGAFLKKEVETVVPKHLRNSADFGAFLKSHSAADAKTSTGPSQQEAKSAGASLPSTQDKVVTVLFGTEYGFSQEVAEKLCGMLREKSVAWPQLLDMANYPHGLPLDKEQVILLVCSTQGDGVPPNEAREFVDWLHTESSPHLTDTAFSVCALGDRSYQHYCRCGKQLDSRLEQLGGRRLVDRVDVNREDWTVITAWMEQVCAALATMDLKTVGQMGGFSAAPVDADVSDDPKKWSKSHPYMAPITSITNLCNVRTADDKITVCVDFDLGDSGIDYVPGDALGIYPQNDVTAVEELLEVLQCEAEYQVSSPSWYHLSTQPQITLKEALIHCYDLRSPKPQLFDVLLELAEQQLHMNSNGMLMNGEHHHTLNGTSNGVGNGLHHDAHHDATGTQKLQLLKKAGLQEYLEQRHVIDVLQDFPFCPPVNKLLSCLRPLVPRLYSISTSMLENPRGVSVTVAVVRYMSLSKDRIGVCSTFLAERVKVGSQLPVYIHKNPDFRLPATPSTPIIMVGPGTGVAPFRAFMQELIISSQSTGQPLGSCWLYFGSRRRDQDYLYGTLLEDWHANKHITLVTAFSREQQHKVYVQNRLRETQEDVWNLLEQGAHFYVCGDAASMAGSVEEALLDIIGAHVEGGATAAQHYLTQMKHNNRYQRDIW